MTKTFAPEAQRSYAVVWSGGPDIRSGSLESSGDGFVLRARDRQVPVPFSELTGAWIARGEADRLRGLPVLALSMAGGNVLRIATLEGAGVLYELAQTIEHAGLAVARSSYTLAAASGT